MIIIVEGFGQLANRIIQFSHFIAFCAENKISLYNPPFKKYSKYFKGSFNQKIPNFLGNKKLNFGFTLIIIKIILKFFVKKSFFSKTISIINLESEEFKDKEFNLSGKDYINKIINSKFTFVKGWLFRDFDNVKKHYQIIKDYFTPIDNYQNEINNFINKIKEKYEILVGVHIRRSDYKNFNDGKFYFDDNVYLKFILQIKNQLTDKKTIFILFSDEQIDLDFYRKNNIDVINGPGDFILDLYSMACCDYIMGPPSTYNYWAAFYGHKKHIYIYNNTDNINISDFNYLTKL